MKSMVLPPVSRQLGQDAGICSRESHSDSVCPQTHPSLGQIVKTHLACAASSPQKGFEARQVVVINEAAQLFTYAIKPSTDLKGFSLLDLFKVVQHAITLSKRGNLTEADKDSICKLFDRLALLSVQSWDRKLLAGQKELQRVLSKELDSLYCELDASSKVAASEDFQVRLSIAKAELSTRLGVGIHRAGAGVNGAQIIKSLEGDAIGVFKPENKLAWYDVVGLIKRFFGQARLLCNKKLAQEFAEVAAHKLSSIMGFNITPAAKMCQIRNKEGAFLAFLSGYKEAQDVVEQIEAKTKFTTREITLFQKMAAYDFLVGNMDCHDGNWFVRLEQGEIIEIRVIDHGNSFIESNPGEMGLLGNQYKWGRLKMANEAFSVEFVDFIKEMNEAGLEQFIQETRGEFLNSRMEALIRERFWTLKMGVLSGQIASPKALSHIHTDGDFRRCREEIATRLKAEGRSEGDLLVVDITAKA